MIVGVESLPIHMADKNLRSIPTVASLDAVVRRVAARLVHLEGEFGGNPDGQLAKMWESIEELNLRVLFIMNTLQITHTLSPIADSTGKIPTRKMSALEAYMHGGGREKLIAGLEAQAKAAEAAEKTQGGLQVETYEGLPTGAQAEAAPANERGASTSNAADDPGPSTYVENPSKFDKQ